MLKVIRSIALQKNFASATRLQRSVRFFGKFVFVLYLGLFVSDCINIDVLYAAIKGDVTFVDDSTISDSLFDTGSNHHVSAFDAPSFQNDHQSFASGCIHLTADNLVKNIVSEDEDSVCIEDAMLSSSFAEQSYLPRPESESSIDPTIPWLDRTINYQRILI